MYLVGQNFGTYKKHVFKKLDQVQTADICAL